MYLKVACLDCHRCPNSVSNKIRLVNVSELSPSDGRPDKFNVLSINRGRQVGEESYISNISIRKSWTRVRSKFQSKHVKIFLARGIYFSARNDNK